MTLTFDEFNLEDASNCNYDYVAVSSFDMCTCLIIIMAMSQLPRYTKGTKQNQESTEGYSRLKVEKRKKLWDFNIVADIQKWSKIQIYVDMYVIEDILKTSTQNG